MMQTLIESLFEELDKQANNLAKHNLESYLITAIKSSNSDIKDAENIKKLNIILLNPTQGDIGWDIFCLEYKVDLPLNVIFSNKLLKDYQKLFLFFWKIKRIKYGQINHLWKKIKNINYNSNKNNTSNKKLIRTSIIFNQEIVHFITNLHNYFSLEVLETQFKKLKLDLSKVKDLDELIKKHKIFVENIKKQCLLDDDNKIIIIKISEIFDIILKFKKVFDVLYSFIYEINYENNYNFTRIKNIEEYVKQIDNLYSEYKNKIIEFIQILELLGKNNIKYLAMKLDYNYYYSLLEKEKNDEKDLKNIKNINKENIRQKILADLDYQNELSENSKNNYDDSNNIIDNNKFKEEKLNSIQNSKINEDQLKEEDEKIKDEENEEIKAQENDNYNNQINLFENNEFNKEK
jgi:gamma-tubulin complex component 3